MRTLNALASFGPLLAVAGSLVFGGCPEKTDAAAPAAAKAEGTMPADPTAPTAAPAAAPGQVVPASASPLSAEDEKKFATLFVRLIKKEELSIEDRKALGPLMDSVSKDLRPAPNATEDDRAAAAEKMKKRLLSIVERNFPEATETLRKDMERFECESLQQEARTMLKQYGEAQMGFKRMNPVYAPNMKLLNKVKLPPATRYDYALLEASETSFRITATGKKGTPVEGDVWEVNSKGQIGPSNNVCTPKP